MNLLRSFSILCLVLASLPGAAQLSEEKVRSDEAQLQELCKRIYKKGTPDTTKIRLNNELLRRFDEILNQPGSMEAYRFDSLKKDLSILNSPDGRFKLINWNLPKSDGTQEYFGFIQSNYRQVIKKGFMKREIRESVQVYQLSDRSAEIKNPENTISDHRKWFGMWYYKIIPRSYKGKTWYTMLAWDGNDRFTQKKIVDVLSFDNGGVPKFGADIFVMPKRYPKRLIFEYSATCTMSLKYSESKDSIIFDHLAPTQSALEGQYQYYCSDMSYDGLGFKKGKWHYKADVPAMNPKDEKDKLYRDPHDRSISKDQSGTINPNDRSVSRDRRKKNLEKEQQKR
jgi:hypothetical protein